MNKTAPTQQVHELVASLRGIGRFVRAFAEAEAIANTLLAAEQRNTDLAAQIGLAEKRMAELTAQTAALEAEHQGARAEARDVAAKAKSKAEQRLAEAQASVEEAQRTAQVHLADAKREAAQVREASAADASTATAALEAKRIEFEAVNDKLTAAREALQNLLKA